MTDEGLDRLASFMRHKTYRQGALILGFDGTSALLGHVDHLALAENLAGNHYPSGIKESVTNEVATNHTSDAPFNFINRIAVPHNGRKPDFSAIGTIAGLLNGGYLGAVVASDPNMQLYISLRQCGIDDLRYVTGDGSSNELIKAAFSARTSTPLFIDAGGALIVGFREGLARANSRLVNSHGERTRELTTKLGDYFSHFEDLYCWGWCAANVPLQWVYKDAESPEIHRIGPQTDCGYPNINTIYTYGPRIDGQDADDWKGAAWLVKLADLLQLNHVAPTPANAAPSGRVSSQRFSRAPLVRPVLTDGILAELTTDVPGREIKIVGVESRHVRQSAANWLSQQTAALDEVSVLREDQRLPDLLSSLTVQVLRAGNLRIVGCYTGEVTPGETGWTAMLESAVLRWLGEAASGSRFRMVFFCPPEMSRWASRRWRNADVWAVTHYAKYLRSNAQSWLRSSLDQLPLTVDAAELERFARLVAEPPDPDRTVPAGFIEEALESWLLDIADSPAARSETRALSFPELVEAWERVVERFRVVVGEHAADGATDAVGDFEPRPVPRPDDFELGPITPHVAENPPDEDEDEDESDGE